MQRVRAGKDSLMSPSLTQAGFQLDSRSGTYLVLQAPMPVKTPTPNPRAPDHQDKPSAQAVL